MTIKEAEERTGLTRSSIRFYEKEKLIGPARNDKNGYRDYSEKDVSDIKKIAYLRTLGISVEDIRSIISGQMPLIEIIERQHSVLQGQIEDLSQAKAMCERMLEAGNVCFDELRIEDYVTDLPAYWNDNQAVFKMDSVRFLSIWGSLVTWAILTALCFLTGILVYAKLPPKIPVQWKDGLAVSLADKKFIFAYPLACIMIRVFLRPAIYARLAMTPPYRRLITEYLANYLCFLALSIEIFSTLFIYGFVKDIGVVLLADTAVFSGILIAGIAKMGRHRHR